jgi:hypothetical protein
LKKQQIVCRESMGCCGIVYGQHDEPRELLLSEAWLRRLFTGPIPLRVESGLAAAGADLELHYLRTVGQGECSVELSEMFVAFPSIPVTIEKMDCWNPFIQNPSSH